MTPRDIMMVILGAMIALACVMLTAVALWLIDRRR